jgi:hypothetical protein
MSRPSTSFVVEVSKTWMPGIKPGMTSFPDFSRHPTENPVLARGPGFVLIAE